jgi:hypothetical protein
LNSKQHRLLNKSPNRWSCLPTAFATGISMLVDELIKEVGHDGSEIVNDMDEPYCRRGFHPQEIIPICLKKGYSVTEIEKFPEICQGNNLIYVIPINNIKILMEDYKGVICGTWYNKNEHAAYYNKGIVYDGINSYPLNNAKIDIRLFYIIMKSNQQKTFLQKLREFPLKFPKFTV